MWDATNWRAQEWAKNEGGGGAGTAVAQGWPELATLGVGIANQATSFDAPPPRQTARPSLYSDRISVADQHKQVDKVGNTALRQNAMTPSRGGGRDLAIYGMMMDKKSQIGQAKANYQAEVGNRNVDIENEWQRDKTANYNADMHDKWRFNQSDKIRRLTAAGDTTQSLLDIRQGRLQNAENERQLQAQLDMAKMYSQGNAPLDRSATSTSPVGLKDPNYNPLWNGNIGIGSKDISAYFGRVR
jgi:hypothetical protein